MIRRVLSGMLFLGFLVSLSFGWALTVEDNNLITINGISFHLNLVGEKRIADNVFQTMNFIVSHTDYPDSILIKYSSPEMDFNVTLLPKSGLKAEAYLANSVAYFKEDIYIHKLFLSLSFVDSLQIRTFKGVQAINSGDMAYDENLTPYTDKVVKYSKLDKNIWIVASNYADCKNVESLTSNAIILYDYKAHYFHFFYAKMTYSLNDAMFQKLGDNYQWSFLLFAEKPVLLDINRWPNGKKAAVAITNDADVESLNRLKAVFFGSNNPNNPKYLTQGLIANNIKLTSTFFGEDFPAYSSFLTSIMATGNSIGYHTYTDLADPPGSDATALLTNLLPYNIRTWIDHSLPGNPEDMGYNGLVTGSSNYIADVINQSNIDYIWPADTPPTNPFNAFEETWRLPHFVYEAKTLTRPIWFFGRTRTEAWEYTNGQSMITMKYQMTTDNLDQLIRDHGLHIGYTHFCFNNTTAVIGYYIVADNGDYEVRPEVNDMFKMLDFYQKYRGLWVDNLENIFDRMLATEQVKVVGVQDSGTPGIERLTIANESSYDLSDFNFTYQDQDINIPTFSANSTKVIYINGRPDNSDSDDVSDYEIYYSNKTLVLKNSESSVLPAIEMQVYNIRGQRILTNKSDGSEINVAVPFHGKASGIYLVRIIPATGKPKMLKVTVIN